MNNTIALAQNRIGLVVDSRMFGEHCIVIDAKDYEIVSSYRWYLRRGRNTFYGQANVRRADGTRIPLKLHRLLLPDAPVVDHIDRDGLNNTRENLRAVTMTENNRNSRMRVTNTSGYRGVFADQNQWQAQIQVNGKRRHLGRFSTAEDAARAFDLVAREVGYLESALNFPEDS